MNKIKVLWGSLISMLTFVPALALAQTTFSVTGGVAGFLVTLRNLMGMVVPILIGLAVIAFLWGVLRFVFFAGNDDKRKEGKNLMIYGLIGIVVMVSVWGLVIFVQSAFGLNQASNRPINGPMLPYSNS